MCLLETHCDFNMFMAFVGYFVLYGSRSVVVFKGNRMPTIVLCAVEILFMYCVWACLWHIIVLVCTIRETECGYGYYFYFRYQYIAVTSHYSMVRTSFVVYTIDIQSSI